MKNGLDFFSIPCVASEATELIEAELGYASLAVIIKLLCRIYGQSGYYCLWDNDCAILFARKNGIDKDFADRVVSAALRRGLFNADVYRRHKVLTSAEIQSFFLSVARRRKNVSIDPRYLCYGAGNHGSFPDAGTVEKAVTVEKVATVEPKGFPLRGSSRVAGDEVSLRGVDSPFRVRGCGVKDLVEAETAETVEKAETVGKMDEHNPSVGCDDSVYAGEAWGSCFDGWIEPAGAEAFEGILEPEEPFGSTIAPDFDPDTAFGPYFPFNVELEGGKPGNDGCLTVNDASVGGGVDSYCSRGVCGGAETAATVEKAETAVTVGKMNDNNPSAGCDDSHYLSGVCGGAERAEMAATAEKVDGYNPSVGCGDFHYARGVCGGAETVEKAETAGKVDEYNPFVGGGVDSHYSRGVCGGAEKAETAEPKGFPLRGSSRVAGDEVSLRGDDSHCLSGVYGGAERAETAVTAEEYKPSVGGGDNSLCAMEACGSCFDGWIEPAGAEAFEGILEPEEPFGSTIVPDFDPDTAFGPYFPFNVEMEGEKPGNDGCLTVNDASVGGGVDFHCSRGVCGGAEKAVTVGKAETVEPKGFPLRGSSRVAGDEVSLRGVDLPFRVRGCGVKDLVEAETAVTEERATTAVTVGKMDDNNPSVGCDDFVCAREACGSCSEGWIEPAGAEAFEGILEPEEPFGPTIAPDFDPDTAFGPYFPFNVEMEGGKPGNDGCLTVNDASVGGGYDSHYSRGVCGEEEKAVTVGKVDEHSTSVGGGVDSRYSRGVCGGEETAVTVEEYNPSGGGDDSAYAREACGSCSEGWIEPAGAEAFEGILEPEEPFGPTIAPDFDPDTAFGPYFPFNVEMEGGKPGNDGCLTVNDASVGDGVDSHYSRGICGGAEKVAMVATAEKADAYNPSVGGGDDFHYSRGVCGREEKAVTAEKAVTVETAATVEKAVTVEEYNPTVGCDDFHYSRGVCGGAEKAEMVATAEPKGFPLRGSSRVAGDEVSLRGIDSPFRVRGCGEKDLVEAETVKTAKTAKTVGNVDDNNPSVGGDDSVYAGEAWGSCPDGWIEPAGAEAFEGILEPEEPFGPTIVPDFDPDTAFGPYFPFNVEMEGGKPGNGCSLTANNASVGGGVDSHYSSGVCGGAEKAEMVEKVETVATAEKVDDNNPIVGGGVDSHCSHGVCGEAERADDNNPSVGCDDSHYSRGVCGVKDLVEAETAAKAGKAETVGNVEEYSVSVGFGADSVYVGEACGSAVTVGKAEKKLAFGVFSNVFLTAGERSRLDGLIPDCACYIDRFSRKLREKGYRYADHYAALLDWWASDSALPSVLQLPCNQNGEDGCGEELKSEADGFFELALARASRRYKASQGVELCQKSGLV